MSQLHECIWRTFFFWFTCQSVFCFLFFPLFIIVTTANKQIAPESSKVWALCHLIFLHFFLQLYTLTLWSLSEYGSYYIYISQWRVKCLHLCIRCEFGSLMCIVSFLPWAVNWLMLPQELSDLIAGKYGPWSATKGCLATDVPCGSQVHKSPLNFSLIWD